MPPAPKGLRQLTPREQAIVGKYAAQHGLLRGLDMPIADDSGGGRIISLVLPVPRRDCASPSAGFPESGFMRHTRPANGDPCADRSRPLSGPSALAAGTALHAPNRAFTATAGIGSVGVVCGPSPFPRPCVRASKAVIDCLKPRHPTLCLFQRGHW
jgi:hypothetical protein